jgi:imidazolonepropionase-like amidohydrolase
VAARDRQHRWAGQQLAAIAGLLAVLGAGCVSDEVTQRQLVSPRPPGGGLLIEDVAVFTGTERGVLQHHDVLVQADRIVWVRPSAAVEARPPGVTVLPGAGRMLLPGFVDTHTHLTASGAAMWAPLDANMDHNLEAWLYAGVTTVYDLSGFAGDIKAQKEAVEDGDIPGPRIFFTHLAATAPEGHPLPLAKAMLPWPLSALVGFIAPQPTTEDQARAFVDDTLEQGADYIKVIYDRIPKDGTRMAPGILRAIIARAHEREVKVFVHIGTADEAVTACDAGADVIAHGPYRSEVTDAQARALAAKPCPIIYTMAGWQGVHDIATHTYTPSEMAREISPPALLDPVTGAASRGVEVPPAFDDLQDTVRRYRDAWPRNVQTLHAAGVPLFIGTDSPLPGTYPGSSFHEELVLLADAGIPPEALLWAATSGAAHLLTDTPDFGTVEEGKAADLVLVEGDPTIDVRAASDIVEVIRAGVRLERHRP